MLFDDKEFRLCLNCAPGRGAGRGENALPEERPGEKRLFLRRVPL